MYLGLFNGRRLLLPSSRDRNDRRGKTSSVGKILVDERKFLLKRISADAGEEIFYGIIRNGVNQIFN